MGREESLITTHKLISQKRLYISLFSVSDRSLLRKLPIVRIVLKNKKVISMKRINIGLKDNTHSRAKIVSILKQVSLSKYIELCIEKSLELDRKLLEDIRRN